MVKFDGLRSRLDRIAWVRYLKQTPVGRAVRRRLRSRVGSGSAYPKWQLRHDPVDVACNLCGSRSSNPVCDNPLGLPIVRCTERSRQEWDAWMDERERRLDEWGIGEFERALGADRRVLELGCAEGYQLAVFQKRGWRVRGYDVNAQAVAHAVNVVGVSAARCGFGTVPEPDETYDLAVLFHMLEHLPDPRHTLDEVHRALKPRGRVLVVTPCADTIVSRTVGYVWFSEPDHMFFFSQTTIRRLLQESGFEIADMQTWLGVASPDSESGEAAHRIWRRHHTVEDDRRVIEQNQSDVMMVMATKKGP